MKYSFLMPYIDRIDQLHNTLLSLQFWYSVRDDIEVLLIPDSKCSPDDIEALNKEAGVAAFVKVLSKSEVVAYSPSPHYNRGARAASGSLLVLTNPEVLHTVDVLERADSLFSTRSNVYMICGCQAAKPCPRACSYHEIAYTVFRWYQHSVHRPVEYHFCSIIQKQDYWRVGGFDERYAQGVGYDDNDFRDAVVKAGLLVVQDDTALTVHQSHDKPHSSADNVARHKLVMQNQALYRAKWGPLARELR